MARSRNIKPGFFMNDSLGDCSINSRLLFIGLWTLADKAGRLENRSKKIKAMIFPYDDVDIEIAISELVKADFLISYVVEGKNYLQIVNWSKHQSPHIKEAESEIPEYLENNELQECREKPGKAGADTSQATLIPDSLIPDSLIPDSLKKENHAEGVMKEKEKTNNIPAAPVSPMAQDFEDDLFQEPEEYQREVVPIFMAYENQKPMWIDERVEINTKLRQIPETEKLPEPQLKAWLAIRGDEIGRAHTIFQKIGGPKQNGASWFNKQLKTGYKIQDLINCLDAMGSVKAEEITEPWGWGMRWLKQNARRVGQAYV